MRKAVDNVNDQRAYDRPYDRLLIARRRDGVSCATISETPTCGRRRFPRYNVIEIIAMKPGDENDGRFTQ